MTPCRAAVSSASLPSRVLSEAVPDAARGHPVQSLVLSLHFVLPAMSMRLRRLTRGATRSDLHSQRENSEGRTRVLLFPQWPCWGFRPAAVGDGAEIYLKGGLGTAGPWIGLGLRERQLPTAWASLAGPGGWRQFCSLGEGLPGGRGGRGVHSVVFAAPGGHPSASSPIWSTERWRERPSQGPWVEKAWACRALGPKGWVRAWGEAESRSQDAWKAHGQVLLGVCLLPVEFGTTPGTCKYI